jgi:GNAT superfamily N-acetyltransferase
LRIAAYRGQDQAALAALWHASAESIIGAPPHGVSVAELGKRIPHELAGGWDLCLGWEDERLVAFMALKPADSVLDQLFVAPREQGRGLGGQLMSIAKQRFPDGLTLRTAAASAACRFYERHGFRRGEEGNHPRLGHVIVTYRWP